MTPEQSRASYRRMFDQRGEEITIRRYTGTGQNRPRFDTDIQGVVQSYEPRELVGGIIQGDQRVLALAEDLDARQFPMPMVKGDKVVVRGKELNVEAVDGNTRRIAGVLIAYELQVRG